MAAANYYTPPVEDNPSFMPCRETTNYMRLCHLIVTVCTYVLRCVLDKYIHPSDLPEALRQNMWILTQCPLNKQQKALLFPKGQPATVISSKQFDISLLYVLLRSIAGIKKHRRGWGKTPEEGDISLAACIERIRISKNTLNGHSVTCQVSDDDFKVIWFELRSLVENIERRQLSGTSFVRYIDELLTADLDPEKSAEYAEELKRMRLEEYETKKMKHSDSMRSKFTLVWMLVRGLYFIMCIYLLLRNVPP